MKNLTDSQKQKLLAMAEIADKGDLAVVTKIFEMQDTFETTTEEVKTIGDGLKQAQAELSTEVQKVAEIRRQTPLQGEPGAPGLPGRDGMDGKDGKDGLLGLDGRDGRDGTDGRDGIEGSRGEDGSPDSPDQVVAKVNSSTVLIRKERIEGLLDLMLNVAANAVASVGITTTNFFLNGRLLGRAKNINFTGTGATVNITGDQANVAIIGTISVTLAPLTGTASQGNANRTFTYSGTIAVAFADSVADFAASLSYDSGSNVTTVTYSTPPQYDAHALGYSSSPATGSSITSVQLIAWTLSASFALTSATRDVNEAITTASIAWPDGATGTFTTDTASTLFPGAIDAYHVTYVPAVGTAFTITQSPVTRDAAGGVTAQPQLTIT